MKPLSLLPQIQVRQHKSTVRNSRTLPQIKCSNSVDIIQIHNREELSIVQEDEQQSNIRNTSTKNSGVDSTRLSNYSLNISLRLSLSNSIQDVSSESSSQDNSQVFEWVSSRYTNQCWLQKSGQSKSDNPSMSNIKLFQIFDTL